MLNDPRPNKTSWFRQPNEAELDDTARVDCNDMNGFGEHADLKVCKDKKGDTYSREQTDMSIEELNTVDTKECIDQDTDNAIVDESILKPTKKRPSRRMEIIHVGKRRKAICAAIVFAAALIAMVLYLVLNRWAVDMPCDWCRKRPSVAFETSQGSKAYVCRNCMKICMICEKNRAVKHYENYAGMIVFACEDCYREMSQD